MGNESQRYWASPAIWDHTVLPATQHRWTCPALTPAMQAGPNHYTTKPPHSTSSSSSSSSNGSSNGSTSSSSRGYLVGVVVSRVIEVMAQGRQHQCQNVITINFSRQISHQYLDICLQTQTPTTGQALTSTHTTYRLPTLLLTKKIQNFSRTLQDPHEKFSRTFSEPANV